MASIDNDNIKTFFQLALSHNSPKAWGPASTFRVYMDKLGWTFDAIGNITAPHNLTIDLCNASTKDISRFVSDAWSIFAIAQIMRRGVGQYEIHPTLTSEVFFSLPYHDQHIIALNLVGGFQTESQKAIWCSDSDGLCPLCSQKDSHQHNPLDCVALQESRLRHPDAIKILVESRPEWLHMPLGRQHPDVYQLRIFCDTIRDPKPLEKSQTSNGHRIFYTDGGAIHPADRQARLASWSVVEDVSHDMQARADISQSITDSHRKVPSLISLGVGLVPGRQTVGRGELLSVTMAAEEIVNDPHCTTAKIFTDAHYVINTIARFQNIHPTTTIYKHPNPDVVQRLQQLWSLKPITCHKLKSHHVIADAKGLPDLWNILGNKMADFGATTVLEQLPHFVSDLCERIAKHNDNEKHMLHKVMSFYADLNRTRVQKLAEHKKQSKNDFATPDPENAFLMPSHVNGEAVFEFLESFNQDNYIGLPKLCSEDDAYHACFQGANLAQAVHQWCETLRWPSDILDSYDYRPKDDWGISWLELLFNFCLCSQQYFPIRKSGRSIDSCYIPYNSEEARLAYSAKRAVHMQTLCMERLIRSLENLQEKKIFPSFRSNQCKSLIRYGYMGNHTGIPCRPIMLQQQETLQWVKKYMHQARIKGSLTEPFHIPGAPVILTFPPLIEISAKDRWKKYVQLQDKRRRARKAAKAASMA